ncbi:MAG TPA: alpha/beta hydrolase [Phycisphaerae bacterium]|nr:alpha/beta hydrolase [Phycisphaerae bacterium]
MSPVQSGETDKAESPSARMRRSSWWVRPVAYAAVLYTAWCVGLYYYQDAMIFPTELAPAPLKRPLPKPLFDHIVTHQIDVPGGKNEAWFLPAPGVSADRPGPAVVFCHGNAEVIDYQDSVVRAYHDMGVSVLLPEYRGYGVAPGKPTQKGILEDNVRFYDWLVTLPQVDRRRIVFHGRSLGGGVACDLATKRMPAAVVLESTFTSVAGMAGDYLVPAFLCKHPFRNDRVLRDTTFPVLIGHGSRDRLIPVSHAHALRDLPGRGVVYIEYDCDHNDFPGAGNEDNWWGRVREFLVEAGILAAPETQPG